VDRCRSAAIAGRGSQALHKGIAVRVALLANGDIGARIARYLLHAGDEICGLVLHPPGEQRAADLILSTFGGRLPDIAELDASRDEAVLCDWLRRWTPELLVSVFYGYRIPSSALGLAPGGGINVHPSFLPYHRGRNPNVWTLIEGTPGGATIHHIAETLDTGDVISRRVTAVRPTDTAETLYARLLDTCVTLFEDTWPAFRCGAAPRIRQADLPEQPCTHLARELTAADEIDLDGTYTGRQLLNLLRARTFPPHPAAWFREQGRKIFVRVELTDAGEL